MTEEERFCYLAANCTYLLSIEKDCKRWSLFACDNFYLEVCYDLSGNGISDMEVFINAGKVDHYLSSIQLNDL